MRTPAGQALIETVCIHDKWVKLGSYNRLLIEVSVKQPLEKHVYLS